MLSILGVHATTYAATRPPFATAFATRPVRCRFTHARRTVPEGSIPSPNLVSFRLKLCHRNREKSLFPALALAPTPSRAACTHPRDPHVPASRDGRIFRAPRRPAPAPAPSPAPRDACERFRPRALSSVASEEEDDYVWTEADPSLQCACRFTDNFFVKRLRMHVSFDGTRGVRVGVRGRARGGLGRGHRRDLSELRAERQRRQTIRRERGWRSSRAGRVPRATRTCTRWTPRRTWTRGSGEPRARACGRSPNLLVHRLRKPPSPRDAKALVTGECADILRQRPPGLRVPRVPRGVLREAARRVRALRALRHARVSAEHHERQRLAVVRARRVRKPVGPAVRDYVAPVAAALLRDGDPFAAATRCKRRFVA